MSGTRHTAGESTAAPEFVPQFSWVVWWPRWAAWRPSAPCYRDCRHGFPCRCSWCNTAPDRAARSAGGGFVPQNSPAGTSRRGRRDGAPTRRDGSTGATAAAIDPSGLWRLRPTSKATGPGDVLLASAACGPDDRRDPHGLSSRWQPRVPFGQGGRWPGSGARPSDARASGMPASAISTGCVDFVLPLQRIPAALLALTVAPGAAELFSVPIPPWARLTS